MQIIMPQGSVIHLNLNIKDIFNFLGVLFFLGLFTHLFQSIDGVPGTGFLKSLFLPIALIFQLYALFLLCTKQYSTKLFYFFKSNLFLLISLSYILLSVVWSIDKAETFRRSIALLGTTAFGILLGLQYNTEKLLKLFKNGYLIIVISSILLAIFLPSVGTHLYGEFIGFWKGVLSFKNQTGWAVAIFLLIWLTDFNNKKIIKPLFTVGFILGVLLLINTHSSTGLIVFFIGVLILITITFINRFYFFRPVFILLLITFISIGIAYFNIIFEYILTLVGKDSSLTGRTSIWLALLPTIEQNSMLGVGYSAFWPNAGNYFQDIWLTELNHAHNTYIELVVDLGFAGFIFCMSFLLIAYKSLFKDMMIRLPQANMIFTLWTVIFIIGFSGKVVFVPNSGLWILMVALLVSANQNKLTKYKDMS